MDKLDAVQLTNWWPGTSDVFLRYGYTQNTTGISGQVESLMAYSSGTASKLFGVAGDSIYDVSSSGAVGAAAVTGLTNSRFQYANMTTSGGSYLVCVNGADKQQVYTGSAWAKDGDGAPYDITGVNSNTLIGVNVFKSRLWYVQEDSLKVWYLALGAIGGAATALDLSAVFSMGGYIMAMGTWTIDAGYGVDDYAVWVTSKGEAAVYRLTDPTSPSGISLIGIFVIGAPIGRRCFMKYAGDMLLICQDGVVPLSGALQSSRLNPRVSLTDKIQFAMSEAISSYGANFGWQLVYFPKENQLYLNVPVAEGSSQQQYVMNTITKSWSNFTGWYANCWEIFNDNVYFGGNGYVGLAWNTNSDNGAAIQGTAIQSFQTYGSSAQLKRFTLMRPNLRTNGVPSLYANVNVDFNLTDSTNPLSFSPTSYGVWDVGLWDSAVWGSDLVTQQNWQGVNAIGYTAAPFLKVSASGINVRWVNTDLVFERGGIL